VQLTGGVQKARTKTQCGRHAVFVANLFAQPLQTFFDFRSLGEVGVDGEIVALSKLA
jgi:hypothetical protein